MMSQDNELFLRIKYYCKIMHRWEFTGSEGEGAKSIPYQLQKLFLHLQVF